MMQSIKTLCAYLAGALLVIVCIIGCVSLGLVGGGQNTEDTENAQMENQQDADDSLYLIMKNDTVGEVLVLYSYKTGLEHYYQYNFSTQFLDKYGNNKSVEQFIQGRVVTLGGKDKDDYLTAVQLSDQVWEQEKVKRFSIDEEKGVFTIGDSNYSISNEIVVFSNDITMELDEITNNDVLTVVGLGTEILSVNVTTGHGILSLTNTELFEGSLLQLGDKLYAKVTENMSIEVQEGTYALTVANDGWGSTREITITRGETTEVDLDTMKGEGKKKGLISFVVNVEDLKLFIDYELVDHTQPLEITYGTHTIQIVAPGYDTWKKYLVVNSEEATLIIELEKAESDDDDDDDKKDSEEATEKDTEKNTEKDTEKDTERDTEKSTEEGSEGSEKEKPQVDTETVSDENSQESAPEDSENTTEGGEGSTDKN